VTTLLALRRAPHASPVAVGLLILANLVPLAGVLFLGWELPTLLAIYWAENGLIGLFAVGRILTATGTWTPRAAGASPSDPVEPSSQGGRPLGPPPPPRVSAWQAATRPGAGARPRAQVPSLPGLLIAPFFLVHYGIFWLGHGVFVWVAFPFLFAGPDAEVSRPDPSVVLAAAVALAVSHAASFLFNWLGGGEFRVSSPMAEMRAPYARVVVLHLTILLGAFAVAIIGAPIGALVVMVGLKIALDLSAHLGERQRAGARLRAGETTAIPGTAGT
jgi:hypothetical protein